MDAIRAVMRGALLGALLTGQATVAAGQDRLTRRITSSGDIVLGGVRSLAQDSVGFIWLGTNSGLLRWDGIELRRWAPDQLDSWINYMTVCPDGSLFVVEEGGTLFEITALGAQALAGPGGQPFDRLRNARCDADGRLWAATTRAVWRRDGDGAWRDAAPGTFASEPPFLIAGPREPGVLVRTARTLWRLQADGPTRRVLDAPAPQALALTPAGDTLLLTWGDGLYRVGPGPARLTQLIKPIGRGIDLQGRGSTVWASFDRFLAAVRPGEPPEVIGSKGLPEGGGLMVVDREGSLWIGTFSGLVQFPEPETVYWNDQHGFPSAHTRYLARTPDRVWASTWQGLGYIDVTGGRRTAHPLPAAWGSAMPLHVDPRGVLWVATGTGLREVAGNRIVRTRPFTPYNWDFHDAPDGGVWLASIDGLQHAPANGNAIVPLPGSPFPPGASVRQILQTRDSTLWLAGDERICRTTQPATAPRAASWVCDSIPGAVEITDLAEMPSGAVWASSSRLGVLRLRDGRWEAHPGNATLTARILYRLRPAQDEGVWLLGIASPPRVRENLTSPLGWDVLETVTAWQGMASQTNDAIEDPDGTLWITTSLGLARVPPAARRAAPAAPRVVLVDVAVDGAPVVSDAPVSLRHRHNRLDMRFAALSYRDPSRIRYQVRLAPQQEWSDHVGPPAFRWIDLPAGTYRAEVRASLDGRSWSATPASFAVTVGTPWFLNPGVLALTVAAILGAAYAGHRARLAVALRLERQRSQISLDLHDEMGSGLGSIGILSGVLTGEGLSAQERQLLATKIGDIAAELGASLSDIVWSLRPHTNTLEDVAARLAEHGARLFSGETTRFEARFPAQWPDHPLGFSVSRAVLLIGLEALYNAARHSQARLVTLTVAAEGRAWSLAVQDDGHGLPENGDVVNGATGGGLGRVSMRRRAEEIGGELTWESVPEGGTRVTLRIVPRRRLSGERLA
jgi:signal transduction histidine kinase/ligand-binding sensor domain-containing protein